MELTITKGRGYVSSDKNKTEDLPIGVIPIDSIYTPVERVNLTVENTRVDVYKRQALHRTSPLPSSCSFSPLQFRN